MNGQSETLLKLMEAVSHKLIANEKTLTDLDSAIGDGDCGTSIRKGFQAVLDKLPLLKDQSPGGILKQIGMVITSTIGGVSGAIYATAFLRAGIKAGDRKTLGMQEIHDIMQVALDGVKERGEGTKVGDKTMVDALEPAVAAFGDGACSGGEDATSLLEKALEAAREGSDRTVDLVAKKGRASYLGERSKGHRDAGSVVICLMFEAAHEFFAKEVSL
jgi:dihydroxyacetone kinase-like protein